MSGTLFVVGTPIGNLEDLTPRAAHVLETADICYAEDTRRSRKLLTHLRSEVSLRSLHEHNERGRIDEVLGRLEKGETVAIVSDAGTPTVSDPGQRLLEAVLDAGHRVCPIPGASAVVAALSVSGLAGDRFFFAGFSPRRGRAREGWIQRVRDSPDTVVVFEAPTRVASLLENLRDAGLQDRLAVVCRELTKIHEEIRPGTIAQLATVYDGRAVKGEVTLVIAGRAEASEKPNLAEAARVARELAAEGVSRRDVADRLTEAFGLSRNEAYRLSLGSEEADPNA